MDFEATRQAIDTLPDEQKPIALSVLADIEYWNKQVEELQKCKTYQIDPKNALRQRKLPAHDMLKEAQRMKLDAMRTLVQIFNKDKVLGDDSPLAKMLEEYA